LFDDGLRSEGDDAEPVARSHGFMEQADGFPFGRGGLFRHGCAAVGHHDDGSGAVRQPDRQAGEGQNHEEEHRGAKQPQVAGGQPPREPGNRQRNQQEQPDRLEEGEHPDSVSSLPGGQQVQMRRQHAEGD
jgi:hypothetical protein